MKAKYLFIASRPKTLAASICPILIGTLFAIQKNIFHLWVFLLTLCFGLLIQIATNFANDYFDGIKGADTLHRKGPVRVTHSGLVSSQKMLFLIFATLITAVIVSLPLILRGGLGILLLLPLCIFFAIFYTASDYAISYLGLGDFFVFLFFGPVTTVTTAYLQTLHFDTRALWIGMGPGLISTAILVVNNLRDIEEDRSAHKKTLAVRFGKNFAKYEYLFCMLLCLIIPFIFLQKWSALILIIPIVKLCQFVIHEQELNWVLEKTGLILVLYTLLFYL